MYMIVLFSTYLGTAYYSTCTAVPEYYMYMYYLSDTAVPTT